MGQATANGILADGSFASYTAGLVPIINDAVPSWTLTGVTGWAGIKAVNIPPLDALGFGPDSEVWVLVSWSCNSSANTKTLGCNLGNPGAPFFDTQTTNISNEWFFRISCRGSTQSQLLAANQVLQSTTIGFVSDAFDFTQPQYLAFAGNLANAADSMRVERVTILISNPVNTTQGKRFAYGKKMFYGANSHYDDIPTQTTAQILSACQQINVSMLRMNSEYPLWTTVPTNIPNLQSMATALQGTGVQMYCLLDLDPTIDGTNLIATEGQAYTKGWSHAMVTVSALKPLGVTIYECGNEMDQRFGVILGGNTGAFPNHFSPTIFPIIRGIIRGAIAGVRSLGCTACSNATTVNGVGFLDMLWKGINPDSSVALTGPMTWDITAFHNYQPYGSLVNIEQYTNGPWMNTLDYMNRAYKMPIYISEFNGQSSNTQAQNLTWTNRVMYEFYANRYRWNIAGINIYQLFQGNPWAQVLTPGTPGTLTVQGTGVQSFISSNPDTGL